MTPSQSLMTLSDWFGLATVISVVVVGLISGMVAYYGSKKEGRQKIAEARLDWSNSYSDLTSQLYGQLKELERLQDRGKMTIRRRRLEGEARTAAVEMLLMINPSSTDIAASDEYDVERDCLSRLAHLGISIDMDFVRKHRAVVKHAWRQAKSEF